MRSRLKRRWGAARHESFEDDPDPMEGVANLFDIGVVFITGLVMAFMSTLGVHEFLNPESRVTITKQSADGGVEIITKEGKKITAVKVTKEKTSGRGTRLGVAYRLENGTMVYVPEQEPSRPGR